jgi:enoyl-CoA hydratase/carnithine racemase
MSEHVEGSVSIQVEDFVATITLDRPSKLNAVTPVMAGQIVEHIKRCNEDDSIRAVVLTGAGPKSFCAGSDIGTLDDYTTPWNFRNRPDYCDAVRGLLKPAIAAINGYAFGGGLETSLSCDIRIASSNARFAAPEIKLGWIGGGGMAAFLAHSVGPSNAALMLMTGDPVDAERACRWGLVSEVVDTPEQVVLRAQDIARTIGQRAPIAAETAKSNLHAAFNMPLENAIQYERDLQAICFATADAREGRLAFKEKRQAVFLRK